MIFVTVGTHEQQFDRLVKTIDEMVKDNRITEEVIIQYGYCNYIPKYCLAEKFFSYAKMREYVKNARIVITHGGPSSFIMALQEKKIPIVFPREKKFNEHVNNHQVDFCKSIEGRLNNIIVVDSDFELEESILNYNKLLSTKNLGIQSNNENFVAELNMIILNLFSKK